MQFVPTENFEAYGNQYCKGLLYTVRPQNDDLARRVAEWASVGMVVLAYGDAVMVSGQGTVED